MKNQLQFAAVMAVGTLWVGASAPAFASSEPFIGEIAAFGSDFCPTGWTPADGRLINISQNTALFSLLGTYFGGDGRANFALPDLRGRIVIGRGQGPGLSDYAIGQPGGSEAVTLTTNEMPSHAHSVADSAAPPSAQVRNTNKGGIALARSAAAGATESTQSVGGGQPHENLQPFLATTTCIAIQGIFPSRP